MLSFIDVLHYLEGCRGRMLQLCDETPSTAGIYNKERQLKHAAIG